MATDERSDTPIENAGAGAPAVGVSNGAEAAGPSKAVFSFGNGQADGDAGMTEILGGKGANIAEMTRIGIPVPPGFTISAKMCQAYLDAGDIPDSLRTDVAEAVSRLEAAAGRRFGDPNDPLLVSVRSGAKFSMPGMMDTILNLGLNDRTAQGLATQSNNPRFAYDSYRRFMEMYGRVVFGIGSASEADPFEHALEARQRAAGVARAIDLEPEHLVSLISDFKQIVQGEAGAPFPEEPWDQLWGAIRAVFSSWGNRRARNYRRVHGIPDDLGTAVNVMAMVYGNLGEDSGSGVAFSRDPSTGENQLYGEFLTNAQGEDVVSGTRDPEPIAMMATHLPEAYREFERTASLLERHYRDVQDLEFTVERGKLYLLQTRRAKRTVQAAVRAAVAMVSEGIIDRRTAVNRIDPDQLDQLLHSTIDPDADVEVITQGLPASPGAAVGQVVFDADTAAERGAAGEPVILVRRETSPDDFHGMVAAQAILTARGGMTSHAAVVARGMGKCCVAGARDVDVDPIERSFTCGGTVTVREGDWITLDGSAGRVLLGRAPLVKPDPGTDFETLMCWADEFRAIGVRANADNPEDAAQARAFGAEGIGLCRTEHMFFQEDRIHAMREMILADDEEGRRRALDKLMPMQQSDFAGIFRAMDGYPVTIRLLDPPLHEFLPHDREEIAHLANSMGRTQEEVHQAVQSLTEANPMLGHRGCRLGVVYPEITEMQVRAIMEAACEVASEGVTVMPEIMVPLVAHVNELEQQAEVARRVAEQVLSDRQQKVAYLVGTMIELPRAALTADEIGSVADFFSFGTNDLTQTTFGLSRDDSGRFLPHYVSAGILSADPFQTIDQGGVGKLVEMGTRLGRRTNPGLKVGICGEHGGDPASVKFCHGAGLNYVSCSPFRVPIARLAAAQASLGSGEGYSTA